MHDASSAVPRVGGPRQRIRVLIVDDAVVVRRLLTAVIDEDPDLEVVGVAADGAAALQKLEQLRPDVVTLDIEMPGMDGLQVLRTMRSTNRHVPVIMFSTLTERGASATLEALSLGASDYVPKPANVGSVNAAMESVRRELIPRIKSLYRRPTFTPTPQVAATGTSNRRIELVAIGSSTGGPMALSAVLASLPADLRVPVVVTQHMPPVFTRLLAQRLNSSMPIEVKEAERGDLLRPGLVLVAPGDHHMVFKRSARGVEVDLNQQPPVNYCRPAVDVMFESVATLFRGDVLAVVLTGMGHDGRDGCATLRSKGAHVIAQDEATSVVWGMPGAVATAGLVDSILPVDEIGPRIVSVLNSARRSAQVA